MKHIEEVLQEALNWPVYTGIWPAVLHSMHTEKWRPRQIQIDRWTLATPFCPTDIPESSLPSRDRVPRSYQRSGNEEYVFDILAENEDGGGFRAVDNLQKPMPLYQEWERRHQDNSGLEGRTQNPTPTRQKRPRSPSHRKVHQIAGYKIPCSSGCGLDNICTIM
jgi:hypothetical protein